MRFEVHSLQSFHQVETLPEYQYVYWRLSQLPIADVKLATNLDEEFTLIIPEADGPGERRPIRLVVYHELGKLGIKAIRALTDDIFSGAAAVVAEQMPTRVWCVCSGDVMTFRTKRGPWCASGLHRQPLFTISGSIVV